MSGPADAPSTAGAQYVTAAAGGSPSGIADIVCSVDGGPPQSYSGASARVPVSGIGVHSVNCYAQNNAVDSSGAHGNSPAASRSLKIGRPTTLGLAFDKLLGLRCHHARIRVTIPGHWITVRRHGKRVRVRNARASEGGARAALPSTSGGRQSLAPRGVRAWHDGERLSRDRFRGCARGPHGARADGAGQRQSRFHSDLRWRGPRPTARGPQGCRPARRGSWRPSMTAIRRRRAPSRGQCGSSVPAKVRLLSVSPSRVPWGGTVRITARLLGGYLPAGGALVRLRIGQGSSYQTYGVETHVTGQGRFTTEYTFGAGYAGDRQALLVPSCDPADRELPVCAGRVRPPFRIGRWQSVNDTDALLAEQLAYYRAQAPEYLENAGVHGVTLEDQTAAAIAIEAALNAAAPLGDVLELACGPGTFTGDLADLATSVHALDAAPEMLEIASTRTATQNEHQFRLGGPVWLDAGPPLRLHLLRILAVARTGRAVLVVLVRRRLRLGTRRSRDVRRRRPPHRQGTRRGT